MPGIRSGGSLTHQVPRKNAQKCPGSSKATRDRDEPAAEPEAEIKDEEPSDLGHTGLIQRILQAVREDDLDTEMASKAELMYRFRTCWASRSRSTSSPDAAGDSG